MKITIPLLTDLEKNEILEAMMNQDNLRMICPRCFGGTTSEKSFSVIRYVSGLWYKCFRASCGFNGFIGFDKVSQYIGTAPPSEKRHKVFTGDINPLPKEYEDYLYGKYEIPGDVLNRFKVGWSYDTNRLILPILGPSLSWRGVSCRSLDRNTKPKILSYREPGLSDSVPLISWYMPMVSDMRPMVIIVEDQISAMKICSLNYPSVSLLSCDITLQKAFDIQKIFQNIVIFLDADALDKALSGGKKVSWMFRYTGYISDALKKRDPKDIPKEELRKILEDNCANIGSKDTSGLYPEKGYVDQD